MAIKQITDPDLYREHIVYFFDTQIPLDITNMSDEDKFKVFQMMTDYAPQLSKLFHAGVDILEHIQGKRFADAKTNPHEGIDYGYDCPIIKQYDEWKAKQV